MSTTVHVLVYDHKHGQDIYVLDTEKTALLKASAIVLEWLDEEVEPLEARKSIVGAIMEGQYVKALEIYVEHSGENLDIQERRIHSEDDSELINFDSWLERAKGRLLKEQQENKEDD